MTSYRVISAADWGGTWSRPPQYEKPLDPYGVLHHTAGNPRTNVPAERAFRDLNESVKNSKGYSFLDYDILCHYEKARDLVTIGWGRGKWMSAATRDFNEQGEAVCWLGYFHPGSSVSESVKPYHIEGAARAFYELHKAKLIAPNATLIGHRSNPAHPNATVCPGNYWYPKPFDQMVARFFQLRDGSAPPPPPSGYSPPNLWGLYPLNKDKPWTKKGDRGNYVRYIQDVIYFKAGGNIARDGVFGAQTERRVKDLQGFFKQKQTGSVSNGGAYADDTWGLLDMLVVGVPEKPPPPPPPPAIVFDPENSEYGLYPLNKNKPKLKWEDRGDLVRYLTGVMRNQVKLSVKITNYYDSEVANAVRAVQGYNGLEKTGWVPSMKDDPRFWNAIDTYASR